MLKIKAMQSGGFDMRHIIGRVWELLGQWGTCSIGDDYQHIFGRYYWYKG